MRCCMNFHEIATVALPAFGAGVLLTMFLPPVILVGTCACASVAFGVICITTKY